MEFAVAGVQLDMPTLTADLKTELAETARKLRIDVIKMLTRATCGHPGGSLGMADIFTALYFGGFVRHDPHNPQWTGPVSYTHLTLPTSDPV